MQAVGAYIEALRSGRGISQEQLARDVGISEKSLRNLEKGRHEPKLTKLAEIVELIQGSTTHVSQLMKATGTVELAHDLAKEALAGGGFTDEQRALLEGLSSEQKQALLDVARQMK